MKNEIENVILIIAEKLGTTAEHLWGVLLKQAPVSGIIDIFLLIIFFISLCFWVRFVKEKTSERYCPIRKEFNDYPEWDGEGAFCAWASVFVFSVIYLIVFASCLHNIIAAFYNPEYWALKKLIP